jgi:3-oxoacyl-[acyl-carrier protein] reductase
MDLGLKGRTALVTGASKGIGLAIATSLATEGVKVLMIARDPKTLESAAKKLGNQGADILTLAGDVTDSALPLLAVDQMMSTWGRIDILVNNAGGPPMGTFLEHDADKWESALQMNLMSAVRFTQTCVPHMKDKKWGRIISVTSTLAKEPTPIMVLSATARAGVSSFTKSIAGELAPYNITANVVCPGGVLTERLINLIKSKAEREKRDYELVLKESVASIPAGRFAEPKELADVVTFLASERAAFINGVSLSVDGALTKSY